MIPKLVKANRDRRVARFRLQSGAVRGKIRHA
jgi:hypothetical protein